MNTSSWLKLYFPACFSGCLLWLGTSFQGVLWPVLLFALVPLLLTVEKGSAKKVLISGLLAGFIYNISLLYWIVIVLGRYGGLSWYFSVPALLLLALYMSVFVVVFSLLTRLLMRCASPLLALWTIPCLWVGFDWVRSFLFSGFPWMDVGYALWKFPSFIQVADLVGHHGITFLLILVNSLVALFVGGKLKGWSRMQLALPVVVLISVVGAYSATRWNQEKLFVSHSPVVKIGVVQGNIDQSRKWLVEEQRQTVMKYLGQTDFLSQESLLDLVVWPETALPFYPSRNSLMVPLQSFVNKSGVPLLTGAPWYEIVDREKRDIRFYNSAILLLPDGSYGGRYYKSHLVPYGEYVPLKKVLFFMAPLVEAVGDFSAGIVGEPLTYGAIRGGVLICFESIFPDISRQWVNNGANVLINLTNDAWYGESSAPYQSFAMTVFRSIETRRSLVRAANTGISGFVDPLGRVQKSSQIFVPWAASADVVLMGKVTFAVRYGYFFAPLCFFLGMLVVFIVFVLRRKKSYENKAIL